MPPCWHRQCSSASCDQGWCLAYSVQIQGSPTILCRWVGGGEWKTGNPTRKWIVEVITAGITGAGLCVCKFVHGVEFLIRERNTNYFAEFEYFYKVHLHSSLCRTQSRQTFRLKLLGLVRQVHSPVRSACTLITVRSACACDTAKFAPLECLSNGLQFSVLKVYTKKHTKTFLWPNGFSSRKLSCAKKNRPSKQF